MLRTRIRHFLVNFCPGLGVPTREGREYLRRRLTILIVQISGP